MSRFRPSSRSTVPRRAGIICLVVLGSVVALFPGDVKRGVEAILSSISTPNGARAESARTEVPPRVEPLPPRDPVPAPSRAPDPAPAPKPPPAPPKPVGPPRAIVVAIGDAEVAPRLGSLLREALDARGVRGVEGQENSIRLDELVRDAGFDPRTSRVREAASQEGFAVLVLVRGEPVASRKVSFYGRNDVATKWQVRVSAHDLRTGRALGPGWGGELETTERGAVASLGHFLEPISDAVAPLVVASLDEAREKVARASR